MNDAEEFKFAKTIINNTLREYDFNSHRRKLATLEQIKSEDLNRFEQMVQNLTNNMACALSREEREAEWQTPYIFSLSSHTPGVID